MSTKHFVADANGMVVGALRTLVACNPSMGIDETNRVNYSRTHSRSKVSIISGGGSGHEPAWSGYVGEGMLAAAANGEIFASPSAKQVSAAIDAAPSDAGIILAITNYTGDCLHFGLAREKALSRGIKKISVLRATDDVVIGRKASQGVGRRGLAGNILSLKIIGAAADDFWTFEQVMDLGEHANANLVSIGSSLDHCHVPGRENHEPVPSDACELGMGIHNEPGLQQLSPTPSIEQLMEGMLGYLLNQEDADRAYVKFAPGDDVVLLVNNFGGLSNLELNAVAQIAIRQLGTNWNITPVRTYSGTFETSLNGPGFSVSLLNISGAAQGISKSPELILTLLDAPTTAPGWPRTFQASLASFETETELMETSASGSTKPSDATDAYVDPAILDRVIRRACTRALNAEPELTRWDMQMGDGDCGKAVEEASRAIITKLDQGQTSSASLFDSLDAILGVLEDMGGTLGAIMSVYVASFAVHLRNGLSSDPSSLQSVFAAASKDALGGLFMHTSARVGDRTVMDSLIPFCETFAEHGDLQRAVRAAEEGANSTKGMQARFGRATYMGDREGTAAPPDPGAWAIAEIVKGLLEGAQG
ncbi:MAG: hypothetical protein M4579_005048 [Chaenotheca gracillima]|nr:MAG: hypothetical protein M4579_005048 [Chaenotheca gracillima]